MFNYYTYQKKRNDSLKEKNKKRKEKKMIKINKIKREELVHNYEQRVKKFIYKLSEDPNYLTKTNSLFLSFNDANNESFESDKNSLYFQKKRFDFSNFETDRRKAEKYDENQKNLKKLLDEKYPIKKIHLNKNKSLSPKLLYNLKLFNNYKEIKSDEENGNNNNIIQPRLRFKPRNDIERLLDELKDLRLFNGNRDYLNSLKKQIIKMQKVEFDNEMKKNNDINQLLDIIDKNDNKNDNNIFYKMKNNIKKKDNKNKNNKEDDLFNIKYIRKIMKSIEERNSTKENNKTMKDINNLKLLDISNNNNNDKYKNENILNSNNDDIENLTQEELIQIKRREEKMQKMRESKNKNNLMKHDLNFVFKDFLTAKKNLHKGYDIKTYFNCMKNYSLWKGSCFINNNILKKKKNKNRSIENYKTKYNFSPISKPFKEISSYLPSVNKNETMQKFSKTFYINNNSKKYISPEKLVLLLNDYKNNDLFELDNGHKSKNKENIDNDSDINIKENNKNLEIIKKIAFDKDFKGYNFIYNKTAQNFEKYKKRILNLNNWDEEDEKDKNYNKDLKEMCNNILKKYGFIKKIYRESDAIYSKEGNGKLMFTNGLTVSQFSKLYNFKS